MSESSITQFQEVVAHVFFALPEADSFLLAGGLELAAHGLTTRPTEDLDAFTSRAGDVSKAFDAFARAANERRRSVEAVQASETFVCLRVSVVGSWLVGAGWLLAAQGRTDEKTPTGKGLMSTLWVKNGGRKAICSSSRA